MYRGVPDHLQHEAKLAAVAVRARFALAGVEPADDPHTVDHRCIDGVQYYFVAAAAHTYSFAGWTWRTSNGGWLSSGLREPWKEQSA